jgi:fructose-1,6-bisphosphatase/inositol monophosphatase family enzyme
MTELDFLQETLDRQSQFARDAYARRASISVSTKADANDLLTEADLAIQANIVEAIHSAFPGDHIVGEESGLNVLPNDTAVRCWFIDPIDGTQNFVRGLFPAFGVSIAFAHAGHAQCGGVSLPEREVTFLAQRDHGATANGKPISVSTINDFTHARTEIDFGHRAGRDDLLSHCIPVLRESGQVRCHCAAVVGLCSVATGDADAFIHAGLTPWDHAAAVLIAEEAGAKATQFDGSPIPLFAQAPSLAVTNGHVHDALLTALRGSPTG